MAISQILADLNANVIKLDHNQAKVTDSFKKVVLEVTVETNGIEHINQITNELHQNGFKIKKSTNKKENEYEINRTPKVRPKI